QRAMPDLAPAGPTEGPHFADAVGWEVVVEHVALPALPLELLDALLVHLGAEGRDHERLRLAPREERRSVRTREDPRLGRHGPHVVEPAAVRPAMLADDHVPNVLLFDVIDD